MAHMQQFVSLFSCVYNVNLNSMQASLFSFNKTTSIRNTSTLTRWCSCSYSNVERTMYVYHKLIFFVLFSLSFFSFYMFKILHVSLIHKLRRVTRRLRYNDLTCILNCSSSSFVVEKIFRTNTTSPPPSMITSLTNIHLLATSIIALLWHKSVYCKLPSLGDGAYD